MVNTQNKYIVHASLIFAAIFLIYFIFERISTRKTGPANNPGYDVSVTDTTGKLSAVALAGKSVFMSHCASCHQVFKNITGPALMNFEDRGPWTDRKKLYAWLKNPEAFMQNDSYTRNLKKTFGTMMTSFPNLSKEQVDAICMYIKEESKRYGPIASK